MNIDTEGMSFEEARALWKYGKVPQSRPVRPAHRTRPVPMVGRCPEPEDLLVEVRAVAPTKAKVDPTRPTWFQRQQRRAYARRARAAYWLRGFILKYLCW